MEGIEYGHYRSHEDPPYRATATSTSTLYTPSSSNPRKRSAPKEWAHERAGSDSHAARTFGVFPSADIDFGSATGSPETKEAIKAAFPEDGTSEKQSCNKALNLTPLPLPAQEHVPNGVASPWIGGWSDKKVTEGDKRPRGERPPRLAVHLKQDQYADFRPWTGNGAEDVLNETVVRSGYSEKSMITGQSESNMARPTIWNNLKNKNVLPALSTLFVQVMDKRQALGRCTAPSTFKPPPRVTLTDTKREAWLRDLALPEVPLRRLSRTIPHGVRNKTMLDQCLLKRIPLARAVWLIKCVGSNEIRAFRRKGISGTIAQSGEQKWIKEWTSCVEIFLSTVIEHCGRENWQEEIQYTIRLVTALFGEDLVDRAHFLDFVIASFSLSPVDRLPLWILLSTIFWKDLNNVQSRGTRLSSALLKQLQAIHQAGDAQSLSPLVAKLEKLVCRLIVVKPACFIPVNDMTTFESQVRRIATCTTSDTRMRAAVDRIVHRAHQSHASSSSAQACLKSSDQKLFEMLDRTNMKSDFQDLAESCRVIDGNLARTVASVSRWACCTSRSGLPQFYMGVELVRRLAEGQSFNVENSILDVLSGRHPSLGIDGDRFTRLIIELVASGHFHFGTYLQWLIASGGISGRDKEIHLAVLTSVPTANLQSHGLALRQAIMSRLGQTRMSSVHSRDLQEKLTSIVLGGTNSSMDSIETMRQAVRQIGTPEQLSLSHWILEQLKCCGPDDSSPDILQTLTTEAFIALRTVLEATEDHRSLQAFLSRAISHVTQELMVHVSATIQHHADTFKAMGVLQYLTLSLYEQHLARRQSQVQLSRTAIGNLLELCKLQPRFAACIAVLERDLATSEQQHAAAVCSPASDNMLAAQAGDVHTDEDIDRILASGNMMDEKLLARLFSAIVERTVKWTVAGHETLASPCRWFEQLRIFDHVTFDRLMYNLVGRLVVNAGTDQVRAVLIVLISSGCMTIEHALKAFEKRMETLEATNAPQLPRFAVGSLQTFLILPDLDHQAHHPTIYRFRILQKSILQEHTRLLLRFAWHGMIAATETSNIVFGRPVLRWLCGCYLDNPASFTAAMHLGEALTDLRKARADALVNGMAALSGQAEEGLVAASTSAVLVLSTPDELHLPIARLVFGRISANIQQQQDGVSQKQLVRDFQDTASKGAPLWSQLVDMASAGITQELFLSACTGILELLDTAASAEPHTSSSMVIKEKLKMAALTARPNEQPNVLVLERIAQTLTSVNTDVGFSVASSLAVLLQMTIIAISALTNSTAHTSLLSRLLTVLLNLSAKDFLPSQPPTLQLLHDTASLLASRLPSESLTAIYRKLPDAARQDAYTKFILDHEDADTKWLSLASRLPVSNAITSPVAQQGAFSRVVSGGGAAAAGSPMASPRVPGVPAATWGAASGQGQGLQPPSTPVGGARGGGGVQDMRFREFAVRRWEVIPDPTPVAGDGEVCLSLGLFGGRRVL